METKYVLNLILNVFEIKNLFLSSFTKIFNRKYLLVDPTDKEEKVMDGKMVIGMNKHREICTLQVSGEMLLMKDQVTFCIHVLSLKIILWYIYNTIQLSVVRVKKKYMSNSFSLCYTYN